MLRSWNFSLPSSFSVPRRGRTFQRFIRLSANTAPTQHLAQHLQFFHRSIYSIFQRRFVCSLAVTKRSRKYRARVSYIFSHLEIGILSLLSLPLSLSPRLGLWRRTLAWNLKTGSTFLLSCTVFPKRTSFIKDSEKYARIGSTMGRRMWRSWSTVEWMCQNQHKGNSHDI